MGEPIRLYGVDGVVVVHGVHQSAALRAQGWRNEPPQADNVLRVTESGSLALAVEPPKPEPVVAPKPKRAKKQA